MTSVKDIFDRVEIDDNGQIRVLTKKEYCDTPIKRVGFLLAGKTRFYLDRTEVPNSEALNSLKKV
jgi:NCAIR mutase (PurE)-related protein